MPKYTFECTYVGCKKQQEIVCCISDLQRYKSQHTCSCGNRTKQVIQPVAVNMPPGFTYNGKGKSI